VNRAQVFVAVKFHSERTAFPCLPLFVDRDFLDIAARFLPRLKGPLAGRQVGDGEFAGGVGDGDVRMIGDDEV
jgi:hypothetical protein